MAELVMSVVVGKDLPKRFKRAGIDIRPTVLRETNSAILLLSAAMQRNISHNFTRRTGGLEHLVTEPAHYTAGRIEGKVGSPVEYAAIHEFGGTIHAKNVQNLTIPLDAMKTARGVARGTARDVIANPGAYGYEGTFSAQQVIFGKSGSDAIPLFALKPSVDIPARPYAQPAIEEVQPIYEFSMRRALLGLFEKAA